MTSITYNIPTSLKIQWIPGLLLTRAEKIRNGATRKEASAGYFHEVASEATATYEKYMLVPIFGCRGLKFSLNICTWASASVPVAVLDSERSRFCAGS